MGGEREPGRGVTGRVGDFVGGVVDGLASGSRDASRAACVWNRVAGDRGRRHTMGLYVDDGSPGDPVLVVYIDSLPLIQDFQTDHILYEQRLRWSGFPVSKVVFKLSRKTRAAAPPSAPAPVPEPLAAMPPLSAADAARVEAACAGLPDGVRQAAQAAMAASLRRKGRRAKG